MSLQLRGISLPQLSFSTPMESCVAERIATTCSRLQKIELSSYHTDYIATDLCDLVRDAEDVAKVILCKRFYGKLDQELSISDVRAELLILGGTLLNTMELVNDVVTTPGTKVWGRLSHEIYGMTQRITELGESIEAYANALYPNRP